MPDTYTQLQHAIKHAVALEALLDRLGLEKQQIVDQMANTGAELAEVEAGINELEAALEEEEG